MSRHQDHWWEILRDVQRRSFPQQDHLMSQPKKAHGNQCPATVPQGTAREKVNWITLMDSFSIDITTGIKGNVFLWPIFISSLEKCPFMPPPYLLIGVYILIIQLYHVFINYDARSFLDIWFANVLSKCVGCHFTVSFFTFTVQNTS